MRLGRFLMPAQQIALGPINDEATWHAVVELTARVKAPAATPMAAVLNH